MATKTQHHKSTIPKLKKGAWFVPVRGSYLPATSQAWLSYVPYVAYLALTVVIAQQSTNTVGAALLYIVPNWVAASVIMTWVAKQKS